MPGVPHCPECGQDPRAGPISAPRWARLTGIPLILAVLSALAIGLLATRHDHSIRTAISRSADEPWTRPIFTVAQLRAAAQGDESLARAIADHILDLAAQDAMVFRTSQLAAAPFRGHGWHARQLRFGWPVAWLTLSSTTPYEDIQARTRPTRPATSATATWRWLPWQPGVQMSTSRGPHFQSIDTDLGALSASVLLTTGAVVLARRLTIRRRTRRRAVALSCALLAAILLFTPRPRERSEVPWPPRTNTCPLSRVALLASTPAGARTLAALLSTEFRSTPPETLVQFFWQLPLATHDTTTFGRPAPLLVYGSMTPVDAAPPAPAQRRLALLHDSIQHITVDPAGARHIISVSHTAAAALLAPALLLCAVPRLAWILTRARRERCLLREGRCLHCGYQTHAASA